MKKNYGYVFCLPYTVLVLGIAIVLLTYNVIISMQNGLRIYKDIFLDEMFKQSIVNTLIWTVGSVVGQFFVGMGIALLLNSSEKYMWIFRILLIIIPWATPDIVAGVTWKWMYNDMYGVINDILVRIHIIKDYMPWLGTPSLAKLALIIANIWKGYPISAMFYLAGLQTIDQQLYEAAEVDGANWWQRFVKITLPMLSPITITTLMLTTIWTINYFPLIYIMTGGGPSGGTETLVTLIYKTSFKFLNLSKAAAMSNILFIIILMIAFLFLKASDRIQGVR